MAQRFGSDKAAPMPARSGADARGDQHGPSRAAPIRTATAAGRAQECLAMVLTEPAVGSWGVAGKALSDVLMRAIARRNKF